jgi:phage terminase large subunit-like protein
MASVRQRKGSRRSTNSRRDATAHKPLRPFTVDHFRQYSDLVVFDDGERRGLEAWQFEPVEDLFAGYQRNWWIIPEGNGKTTLVALLGLYGADYSISPWIPIGAASAKQARILHDQAGGFVMRTPGMADRFRVYGGYLRIESLRNGGIGIEVFAHDPKTGDGVIPYPYFLLDELHRHPDMRLWELWCGKLRKRGAQGVGISTAGEPETPFENTRDAIRLRATSRKRDGSHLRAVAPNEVLHEWMVSKDEDCSNMEAVKAANPLSTITVETLRQDFELVTHLGDWKRLKCNRPTRAVESAISDKEWDDAETDDRIPLGADVDLGMDVAWKWDTWAMVPLWKGPQFRLLGDSRILVPPRDGSSIHPDEGKHALLEFCESYNVQTVVMDMDRAEDIAVWVEDELGITVIDHEHRKQISHVNDYEAFMDGLRNGTLKHTGCQKLRPHVLNAVARRLPGGDYRFDRPNPSRGSAREQDRRVIDGLSAAAMVVEHSNRDKPRESVYAKRFKDEVAVSA